MLLTVKKTHNHSIELTPPLFWKDPNYNDFIAYLDEKTVARVTNITGNRVYIANGLPENMEWDVREAYEKFLTCTEEAFLQAYNGAWEAIRLEPMEIETGREEALDDYAKDNAV